MSRQVSRGSAGEDQADEQAGVARLRWRKNANWLSNKASQTAEEKESVKQRRKGKIDPSEFRVPKNSKER